MSRAGVVSTIARANLVRLGRDRLGLFFIVVLPFLVIALFGVQGGGPGVTVLGVAGDPPDEATAAVLEALQADPQLDVRELADREALEAAVRRQRIDAGLAVGGELGGGTLDLLAGPAGDPRAASAVQQAVGRVDVVRRPARAVADRTGAPQEQLLTASAELDDPVTVTARLAAASPVDWDGAQRSAAANLVLFVFITSLVGSAMLIETRDLGVTRRMLAGPTTSGIVLLGEGTGRYLVASLQGLIIVLGATLVFGVDWGDPLGVLVVVALFSLVGTGAAMLMGAVFSNAEQAGGVAVPVGIGLGMLGGCMWPLEITPVVMQAVGRLTPHAWALDALDDVIAGRGLPVLPLLVLTGMAAALLAAAGWSLGRTIRAGR